MDVDKADHELLHKAISSWQTAGNITDAQADELRRTVVLKGNDRQQIAQYFFFVALLCTLLAFGAIFINEKLLERIKLYFAWNDLVIAAITTLLSVLWFWYVSRKKGHLSPTVYELYMVLGGLSALTSLVYICKQLGIYATYTTFLLFAFLALAALAAVFRSRALWIGAIAAAIGWFGAYSTWRSADNLFLGMNYPMRFTAFGVLLLSISFLQRSIKPLAYSRTLTYGTGLLLLFIGLWGVSIFGNYNSLVGWQQVRQVHVLAYSILFAAAAILSFFLGIRYKDDMARDFGVLFLIINLYTRYFEYFWDAMNKGIFFLILAITFGLLGWLLERKKKSKHPLTTDKV